MLTGLDEWLEQQQLKSLARRSLGEFSLRVMLEEAKVENAAASAAGWDGDQLIVLFHEGQLGIVHASTWDTVEDAKEFETAAKEFLGQRYDPERRGCVLRYNTQVLLLGGLSEATTESFRELKVNSVVLLSL